MEESGFGMWTQKIIARFQGALSGGWALLSIFILFAVLTAEFKLSSRGIIDGAHKINVTTMGYDDNTGKLTPEKILDLEREKSLKPLDKLAKFSHPYLVRWIVIRIKNPEKIPLVLNLKKAVVTSLDVFEYRRAAGQDSMVFQNIYSLPKPSFLKVFSAHHNVFIDEPSVDSFRVDEQVILVRATSKTRMMIPLLVMSREQAMGMAHAKSMFLGIYYGIIVVMFFYNGFLMLFLRDRVYLFYILYLVAFAGTQLSVDGYVPEYFRFMGWDWNGRVGLTFNLLTIIFLVLYSSDFFVIPKASKPIYRLTQGVLLIFLIGLLATWFVDYKTGIMLAFQFNGVCASFLLVLGFWSFLSGYKPARYFILGNIILIVASLMMSLMMLQVIPSSDHDILDADFMIKLGSAFEVVFFSFALADRINILVEEKHLFQVSLLQEEIRRNELEQRAASESAKALHYMNLAQMTQSLAHDIRRPFSILKVALDQIADMSDNPERQDSIGVFVKKIRQNVGKSLDDVNRLIADVMEMSGSQTSLHCSPVRIYTLLSRSFAQVFPYEDSKIQIHYDLQHVHQIWGDDIKLLRVLVNIIDNARQAMHGEGKLWIKSYENHENQICISVGNSGSFIREEDISKIFEPFFTKGKRNGTGLGLAICKKIIEAHGGEISCSSSQEQGTFFVLRLPLSEQKDDLEVRDLPVCSSEIRKQFLESMNSA